MKYTVILDTQLRVLRAPEELFDLLGFDAASRKEVSWQGMVVEDAVSFVPPSKGEALSRVGYLKTESGEILESSFTCEFLGGASDLVCVEVCLIDPSASPGGSVDKESLDFLTTVSHELRVALNGVIGFANVLNGTTLDVNQRAIVDKLQSCNSMLKGLINDILEFSRVATSKINLRAEVVELEAFAREVVGLFRERARKRGLGLTLDLAPNCKVNLVLPRMRVTQVISNLIANAIKFTNEGWVRVSVSYQNETLCIAVQDTGPGVDVSAGESIFTPFFRLTDQADAPEGTGLGLAISRELAVKMGGHLVLKHPSEGGSLFEFTLPLKESFELADEISANGRVAVESPVDDLVRDGSKRVLVVEDNQLNADILGHFLQDYGVEFDHVDNGRTAVELYQDGKYDLILMDVMLPEMNGYEATEKILAHTRLNPPVPIIGVTAKVFRRDQMLCIEAGMVEVVHKPVDFKQLRLVLDRYLYARKGTLLRAPETPMFAESDARALSSALEEEEVIEKVCSATSRDSMNASTLEAYIDRMKTPDTSRSDIVSTAIAIVDAEVKSLVESIEKGDRKGIGMRAHSLKGALALLGARNILDLAKGLELIASDGRTPLKSEHWKNMVEGSYAEFKAQLEAYMQTTVVE